MEQFVSNTPLSLSGKHYHLSLVNLFPGKGTLRISVQTLKEVHDVPSTCEYSPGRQRSRPQWRHLSVMTKLCGCYCVVTPTALNSACIVSMQEYRKGVRAIPAAVVCSLFALFYIRCGKCWWNSWEGVCFSWHSTGTGQNKVSIVYTGSSNIYMNMAVPASILSQITQVKSQ